VTSSFEIPRIPYNTPKYRNAPRTTSIKKYNQLKIKTKELIITIAINGFIKIFGA
jgi:hypothetical protein